MVIFRTKFCYAYQAFRKTVESATVVDHTCGVLGFQDYIFGLYREIDTKCCRFRCLVRGACIGILLYFTAQFKGCGQAGHSNTGNKLELMYFT